MKLRSIRSSFHRLRFFCPALAAFSAAGVVSGQEGAASLPELPSGFYEAAATVIGSGEEPSFGKLDFELGLLSRYDSNVTLGNPQGRFEEESDFLIQPSLKSSFQLGSGSPLSKNRETGRGTEIALANLFGPTDRSRRFLQG